MPVMKTKRTSEYPTSNATLLVMPVGESGVESVGDLVNSCVMIVGAASVKKGMSSSRHAAASVTRFRREVGIGSLSLR